MKYIYAVTASEKLEQYRLILNTHGEKLSEYLQYLVDHFAVHGLPRCVVLSESEIATQLISDIPIPAYTNEYHTIFCPDKEVWQEIYLQQLDGVKDMQEVRDYYEAKLTENNILQILGHEFVHHSDLFLDEAWESSCWFEEGMCEYISRSYFLSESEFAEEERINTLLVQYHRKRYADRPMEEFGAGTYQKEYAGIFYEYWRSFLSVNTLVNRHSGDVKQVFEEYHKWYDSGRPVTLRQWFGL